MGPCPLQVLPGPLGLPPGGLFGPLSSLCLATCPLGLAPQRLEFLPSVLLIAPARGQGLGQGVRFPAGLGQGAFGALGLPLPGTGGVVEVSDVGVPGVECLGSALPGMLVPPSLVGFAGAFALPDRAAGTRLQFGEPLDQVVQAPPVVCVLSLPFLEPGLGLVVACLSVVGGGGGPRGVFGSGDGFRLQRFVVGMGLIGGTGRIPCPFRRGVGIGARLRGFRVGPCALGPPLVESGLDLGELVSDPALLQCQAYELGVGGLGPLLERPHHDVEPCDLRGECAASPLQIGDLTSRFGEPVRDISGWGVAASVRAAGILIECDVEFGGEAVGQILLVAVGPGGCPCSAVGFGGLIDRLQHRTGGPTTAEPPPAVLPARETATTDALLASGVALRGVRGVGRAGGHGGGGVRSGVPFGCLAFALGVLWLRGGFAKLVQGRDPAVRHLFELDAALVLDGFQPLVLLPRPRVLGVGHVFGGHGLQGPARLQVGHLRAADLLLDAVQLRGQRVQTVGVVLADEPQADRVPLGDPAAHLGIGVSGLPAGGPRVLFAQHLAHAVLDVSRRPAESGSAQL